MICFVINYFKEPFDQVASAIASIRSAYGTSAEVIAIGDGQCFQLDGADVNVVGAHAKSRYNGGAWTHRYLETFLSRSQKAFLIKIDPDTTVLKAVQNLPDDDCIFCRVIEHDLLQSVLRVPAGGAMGFTRGMAERIVNGRYFLDIRTRNSPRYGNYNDMMLMDIIQRNGLKMIDRPDFCCGRRPKHDGATFFHK